MQFDFEYRASDSPLVDLIWHTQSEGGGSFMSPASGNLEMVVTRRENTLHLTLRGPETKASPAAIPEAAEFWGITFKPGTYLPHLSSRQLVDQSIDLPAAASRAVWLHGAAWQVPSFEDADAFVEQLVRQGLLAHDPLVPAALQGERNDLSLRSVQRRFLRATGLTHQAMHQIARARHAEALLRQGVSILDTVEQAGYYDQPHLTRSLKQLIGQTPAEILRSGGASVASIQDNSLTPMR